MKSLLISVLVMAGLAFWLVPRFTASRKAHAALVKQVTDTLAPPPPALPRDRQSCRDTCLQTAAVENWRGDEEQRCVADCFATLPGSPKPATTTTTMDTPPPQHEVTTRITRAPADHHALPDHKSQIQVWSPH
jgi:hypothetical protein